MIVTLWLSQQSSIENEYEVWCDQAKSDYTFTSCKQFDEFWGMFYVDVLVSW